MPKGPLRFTRVDMRLPAVRAVAATTAGRALLTKRGAAGVAVPGQSPVFDLVEITTGRADQHVFRMPAVLGDQISGEEVERPRTGLAIEHLDP